MSNATERDTAELDSELQQLLGQLKDEGPVPVDTSTKKAEVVVIEPPKLPAALRQVAQAEVHVVQSAAPDPPAAETAPSYAVEMLDRYTEVREKVLADCEKDRGEAQFVVDTCLKLLEPAPAGDDGDDDGPGALKIKAGEVLENVVAALEVKATMHMAKVKIVEAGAKLLAASKNQITVQNNVIPGGGNLKDVLSRPILPDDL